MSEFISHRVIATQVLGITPQEVLRLIKKGTFGTPRKISAKLVCVEVKKLDEWIDKHQGKDIEQEAGKRIIKKLIARK